MARKFVVATVVVSFLLGHARPVSAQEDEAIAALAVEAGVDEVELRGAANTTQLTPRQYLAVVGEYPKLVPPSMPSSGPLTARVACIEAKESGGANVANTRGSGAVGVLQYLPATFASHAREMGHPEWSPWVPEHARAVAAHDLSLGRRAQWTVSGC